MVISSTFNVNGNWFSWLTRFEVEAEINSKMADLGEGQNSLHRTRAHARLVRGASVYCLPALGPVSRKSRRLFGPEKPFLKLWLAYSVKLVFSCVVKGMKIKISAKFRASRLLGFENAKKTVSSEIRPIRKVSGLSRNGPLARALVFRPLLSLTEISRCFCVEMVLKLALRRSLRWRSLLA